MNKSDAIKYFGGASKLARRLSITPHAIYQWSEKLPPGRQWTLALLSNFELSPDDDLMPTGFDIDSLKSSVFIFNEQVGELLSVANELAQKERGDILDALIVTAKHNL